MPSASALLRVNWPGLSGLQPLVVWDAFCAYTAGEVTTTEAKGLPDGPASLLSSSVGGLIQPNGKGRISVYGDECPL